MQPFLCRKVRSHWIVFALPLLLLPLRPLRAQAPPSTPLTTSWSWEQLEVNAGADTAAVRWLRANMAQEETIHLFSLVGALVAPEARAELISFFVQDPSYAYLKVWPELHEELEGYLTALESPSDTSTPGLRDAYLVARIRAAILSRYHALPWYRFSFAGEELRIPTAPPTPVRFRLTLDFGPAATLLDILSHPDADAASLQERLAVHEPVFAALVRHRGQSFYPVPLTREALYFSLQRAGSSKPVAQLYRFAFPVGLLHFAEVRDHLDEYRQLVNTLNSRRSALEAHVAAQILPYMPEGMSFSRTVHFLFADGADGWVADGVAAVDLEFLKDDFGQLMRVLTHETFHAVQSAARRTAWIPRADRRQEVLAGVLESIYQEGTANFIAAAQPLSTGERTRLAEEGRDLLEELHEVLQEEPLDEARVFALRDRGIQGAGPFYWLGGRMTEVVVQELGADAVVTALQEGGVRFFELYLDAAARHGSAAPQLSSELTASVRALRGS